MSAKKRRILIVDFEEINSNIFVKSKKYCSSAFYTLLTILQEEVQARERAYALKPTDHNTPKKNTQPKQF